MPAIMMADPGGGRLAPDHNHVQMQQQMQQMQLAQAGQMDQMDQVKLRKQHDLETLRNILTSWNANRLDLFELSMPNEVGILIHMRMVDYKHLKCLKLQNFYGVLDQKNILAPRNHSFLLADTLPF